MDYKKAYEESMFRMKKWAEESDIIEPKEVAEFVFPELAESKERDIRKSIIGFLKTMSSLKDGKIVSNEDFDSETLLEWADWLENQGEQKPTKNIMNIWKEMRFEVLVQAVGSNLNKLASSDENAKIFSLSDIDEIFEKISDATIEQKPACSNADEFPYNNPSDTLEGEIENIWEKLSCDNLFTATKEGFEEVIRHFVNWLEKQGEQKPTKNIMNVWKEMRFEVYQQASGNRHEPNYSDDTTKLFSLNDIDEIIEKVSNCVVEQKPADKKYTFNAIPRLLSMIQSTDRAKAYCQKLIDILIQEGYSADAKIVSNCLKQMNGEKVAMATMDEQNSSWSEEEEARIDRIINILDWAEEKGRISYSDWEDYVTYVKSLKPQNKQNNAWNEEDEKMMNQLHSWMKEFGGAEEYTEKVYNWLQGLIEKQGKKKEIDYNEELKKCKANPLYFFDKYVKLTYSHD